ncbi:MAG: Gfo/Idh/MocA family protein [Gemmatimonadota bacterium]
MARDVRVAVIGAGGAAQVVHLPILKRLPAVEVVGIVDPELTRARTIAERFHIPGVARSLSDLAGADQLEAVVVCTPNHTHEEVVLSALHRGLHVLCERPLSVSAPSAARMIEAARSAERQLMVAMNQRFRYDVRAIRHFVTSGELGDVFFVRSSWLNQRYRRPRRGWRTQAGGGVMMDLGAQAIDVALWLLGYPAVQRVTARFHRGEGVVDDSAVALLSLTGGATISVEATWELMEERDRHALYVFGTRGSARTAPFRVQKEMETGLIDVTPPLDRSGSDLYTDSYRQEWAEFLRLVRGEKPMESPDEQVHLLQVLEACYRSAEEGREVAV